MAETEFNLLQEPWIRVVCPDYRVQEVTLTQALLQAHSFAGLGGELAAQDTAVLRLLLAVLHRVFSQVDETGEPAPLEDADDALDRWEALWRLGHLPEKPIRDYLDAWQDRFWLFHPERPFYQVLQAAAGTAYTSAKLNGELSESNNKIRLFPTLAGEEKTGMSYTQAARWLLFVNGFDDTSAKRRDKSDDTKSAPGVGWLGKLGLIAARGENLFETLLLNLVLLDEDEEPWKAGQPTWELDTPRSKERTQIVIPGSQTALLTLQSRRVLLERKKGRVTGYTLLGGDFFDRQNAFTEQMTIWSKTEDKVSKLTVYQPRRHDTARQMWREFPSTFVKTDDTRCPGVVHWVAYLQAKRCLDTKKLISFDIASVQYGDKDFFVIDAFHDELTFHTALLSDLGEIWRLQITGELDRCNQLAWQIGRLAVQISKAAGGDAGPEAAKEQLYARLDAPFREWLCTLDPEQKGAAMQASVDRWQKSAQNLAISLGRELVDGAGENAFVGRYVTEKIKNNDVTRHYCAPEAFNWFLYNVKQIYT